MNFIKPKEQLLAEIRSNAEYKIRDTLLGSGLFGHNSFTNENVVNALTFAMSNGIAEATKTLIENIYTDQQFEEDIGLREKPDRIRS